MSARAPAHFDATTRRDSSDEIVSRTPTTGCGPQRIQRELAEPGTVFPQDREAEHASAIFDARKA